ncbi:hypothetical protein HD554DRAFT_2125002 [Boletus coccyginus]|nr:hypothetical protein HD554DRAFT_2125002 [Boletus coccyginus]
MSQKKRKISDFTTDDTSRLLLALVAFQENLDETDEDLPQELIPALKKPAAKLRVVPHISFSRVDDVTFNQLGIELKPMVLLPEKRTEIEALGLAEREGNWLSIDATKELLRLIRSHVSRVNEAGSRILVNAFLLRLTSVVGQNEMEINIIPEFPISKTTMQGYSFGGVVDFVVTQAHSKYNSLLLENPVTALAPHNTRIVQHANIFEAKRDNVNAALPQAVVAAASYCKQHELSVMRGCITSGEQWAFFVYKTEVPDHGSVAISQEVALGSNLEELPLLLGLLRDLVENAGAYEQRFFEIVV